MHERDPGNGYLTLVTPAISFDGGVVGKANLFEVITLGQKGIIQMRIRAC